MIDISCEEILKLDKILFFLNENKRYSFDKIFLAEKFEITLDEFNFLYQKIIQFSIDEYHIVNVLDKNTNYKSISCDFSTDHFIKSGGFKEYYRIKKERELDNKKHNINIEKIIVRDNYENISSKNLNISSKNLNINSSNPTTNNEKAITNPKHTINSIMLQFWKLISENKLISSFLFVVILWVIKKYFNIDLKI